MHESLKTLVRRIMDDGSSDIAGKISCPLHVGLVVARYLSEVDGVHDRCHMSCRLRADNLEDQRLPRVYTFKTKKLNGRKCSPNDLRA